MGTTVIVSMDQLVCESVVHVALRVDIVLAQYHLGGGRHQLTLYRTDTQTRVYLCLVGIKPSSYCGATRLTHQVTVHVHLTVEECSLV